MKQKAWLRQSYPLVLVLFALVLAGCFGPPAGSGFGSVYVTVEPEDVEALVFLGDDEEGVPAPAQFEEVPVGTHSVRVEADGFASQTKSVTVARSKTVTVHFALEAEDPDPTETAEAVVSGYVSENRGGRRVPGATVTAYESGTDVSVAATTTDEAGRYTLPVPAGVLDIVVEKNGHAQGKRQALVVAPDDDLTANLISKALRDPRGGPAVAPTLAVFIEDADGDLTPFEAKMVVDPTTTTLGVVRAETDNDMYRIKVHIGHEDDEADFQSGILQDELVFGLGDLLPPLGFLFDLIGETELIVTAYDYQNNWTEVRIPFVYETGEPSVLVGQVHNLELTAFTYGHDLGLYMREREQLFSSLGIDADPWLVDLGDGTSIDASRLDKDVTMYTVLQWEETFYEEDGVRYFAEGYEIERAFHRDGPWKRIARVGPLFNQPYVDTSPELAPGKAVYYRVRAVGPNGETGPWSAPLSVIPLDRFEINLVDPDQDATDVSLTPTLRWEYEDIGADEYFMDLYVSAVTGDPDAASNYYMWYVEELVNETEVEYNFDGEAVDLKPAHTYMWNVIEATAVAYYRDNSMAIAFAWTGPAANDGYAGAANGAFLFTTSHDD